MGGVVLRRISVAVDFDQQERLCSLPTMQRLDSLHYAAGNAPKSARLLEYAHWSNLAGSDVRDIRQQQSAMTSSLQPMIQLHIFSLSSIARERTARTVRLDAP